MKILGERIKELRKSKNLTQKQLAEILNVKSQTMQMFEYGTRRPKLENLITLADYFDVSLDYLVGRTDKREVNS
jgi:transcriptional regulator with XRE-family HTH domain